MQQALDRTTNLHPGLSWWAPLVLGLVNRSEYWTSTGSYYKGCHTHGTMGCRYDEVDADEEGVVFLKDVSVLTDLDILCSVATASPEVREDGRNHHDHTWNGGRMPASALTSDFCRVKAQNPALESRPTPLAQCVESVPLYDLTLPELGARLLDDNLDDGSRRADTALELICGSAPCRAMSSDFWYFQLLQNQSTQKAVRHVGPATFARLFDCACDQTALFTSLVPTIEDYAERMANHL